MTKIVLVLARGPGKPDGDIADRLTLNMGLTSQGQIDLAAYDSRPHPWLAQRETESGSKALEISRIDEGWALQSTSSQDDPVWVFEGQIFRPGELVLLTRPDQSELLFRIVATE